MKTIETLIEDIYKTVQDEGGWSFVLETKIENKQQTPRIRLSGLGPKCPCAYWYSIHKPELAEPLPPWAKIKYMFGHMVESLAIQLAKQAGHEVVGEQDELNVNGVLGHRDCVIDGYVVDVKSTSSYGFAKFKDGTIAQDDPFGYLGQLDGYLVGCDDDPLVRHKDVAFLLAVDKTLGHMCLYRHQRRSGVLERIEELRGIIAQPTPPKCTCGTVPDGKSGNMKLDVRASYSAFKYECFPRLRTFIYADGPRYLTRVEKLPNVPEVDRYGNFVTQSIH